MLARAIIIAAFLSFIISFIAACRQSPPDSNANSTSNSTAATSDTPPFPTREPERYQATIVTSGSSGNSPSGQSAPTEQRTFVARDGLKRRTEFELRAGVRLVMLELPSGHFVLNRSRQAYAELTGDAPVPNAVADLPPEFSPEALNNSSRTRSRYERLGAEDVNGRTATKYRVTSVNEDGQAIAGTETLIWVDDALGMPVRSETVSGGARFTMEMQDVKQDVDPALFELPESYRKESLRDFYASLFAGGGNSSAGPGH